MSARISDAIRQEVRDRARQRCEYCQSPEWLTGLFFPIDHILPRRAGGSNALDNLCLACSGCNGHKYIRTTGVDPESNATVALYHPRHQRWSEHFVWSRDGVSILGLTATGRATIETLQLNRPQAVDARRLWVGVGWHPPVE